MEKDLEIGANLSPYRGLNFLSGNSPQDLLAQLNAIRVPFKILSIYAQGSNHVAWIDTGSVKIKKVTKKIKE